MLLIEQLRLDLGLRGAKRDMKLVMERRRRKPADLQRCFGHLRAALRGTIAFVNKMASRFFDKVVRAPGVHFPDDALDAVAKCYRLE